MTNPDEPVYHVYRGAARRPFFVSTDREAALETARLNTRDDPSEDRTMEVVCEVWVDGAHDPEASAAFEREAWGHARATHPVEAVLTSVSTYHTVEDDRHRTEVRAYIDTARRFDIVRQMESNKHMGVRILLLDDEEFMPWW